MEAILKREKEKAFVSLVYINLKALYSTEVAMKHYIVTNVVPQF